MGLDTLKEEVTEYKARRTDWEKDNELFGMELEKVDELSKATAGADTEIRSSVDGIRHSFDEEKWELEQQGEDLEMFRDDISRKISGEQMKLDAAQKRLDRLGSKKYTGDVKAASKKCDELLGMLDEMMGSIGKVFGKSVSVPVGEKFGNFDIEKLKNGSNSFVRGCNYEQFIRDYYTSDRSTYESLDGKEIITTISPGAIEGISLGEVEAENPSIFWQQHKSGGTMASFVEIASHIPEVKNLLDQGFSLEDIKENPRLEACAALYFDKSNMPRVVESNGYYEFEGNGRHRILAAREAGYDIPVKIVGVRRWS